MGMGRLAGFRRPTAFSLCEMKAELEREQISCLGQIENKTTGCTGMWDKVMCWPSGSLGEVVSLPCPKFFFYYHVSSHTHIGTLSKTCTEDGWTVISFSSYSLYCDFDHNNTAETDDIGDFYTKVRVGYTIGHSVSLISLTAAIITLCFFRKLHCTRNYIHMNLFVSFILKAMITFIKDVVMEDYLSNECHSYVGCNALIVFFNYAIMASYFWLLVEGLYLHALLAVSFFSEKKFFWCYVLIGWGVPAVFLTAWAVTKVSLKYPGCWELIEDLPWWIIKTPIMLSILVNFVLFICIIRILQQKINCPDIGRKESNQYSRLAKSTLLLIPLFGMNYIIFAYIPKHVHVNIRMVFDLVLGSFQGFIVAVLYCFMNGEVQSEVRRKWRRWTLQQFLSASDNKYQAPSMGSNGNNFSTQITLLTKCSPTMRRTSTCQEHLTDL
ncbi:hypothetical protein NHX12_004993 [Muraenolepis orangiensis]|uniref:Uncharacterized protein n=1 Tax=Muraenolepis orangiensis TaxID=630683 RepID=A0A9Q0IEV5_9TELE|nr:hypothetical protein NHX12_004993 [Muraenolepis orangiensis]